MTTIICKLKDSGGSPLTGFVRVIAAYIVNDYNTGVVTLPVPKDTQLVNGECSINVQDTALARVSYRFEVWQVTASTTGMIWEFNAQVPASIEPIFLTDLAATGITRDALDDGLLSVTRRILVDDTFWERLRTSALNIKGQYNNASFYRRGDAVVRDGSSYVSIFDGVHQGKDPLVSPTHWLLYAAKGEVAANLVGDNEPYNATSWLNVQSSPTKNALRNVFETKAPIASPTFTNARNATNWLQTDYSDAIPNTKWVKDRVDAERAITVNSIDSRVDQLKARHYQGSTRPWGVTFLLFFDGKRDIAAHNIGYAGNAATVEVKSTLSLLNTSSATRMVELQYDFNGSGTILTPEWYVHLLPNTYTTLHLHFMWSNQTLANPTRVNILAKADVNFSINVAAVQMFSTVYPA